MVRGSEDLWVLMNFLEIKICSINKLRLSFEFNYFITVTAYLVPLYLFKLKELSNSLYSFRKHSYKYIHFGSSFLIINITNSRLSNELTMTMLSISRSNYNYFVCFTNLFETFFISSLLNVQLYIYNVRLINKTKLDCMRKTSFCQLKYNLYLWLISALVYIIY